MGDGEKLISGVGVKDLARVFAAMVQQNNDAIAVADDQGIVTQWNRAASDLFGYTAAEAIGRHRSFLAPEGRPDDASDISWDAGDGQLDAKFEVTFQRKDGRLVDVSVTISDIVTDDGRKLGTVALMRDISAMLRARTELEENERRMNEAQELAHVGSWDWDLALEFPNWSRELCRIYGYSLDHIPSGADLLERVYQEDQKLVVQRITEAKHGESNDVDYRIQLPDGEIRHVHARHHVRLDENGEPLGVHGVVQDVTERKRYELELERLATHDALTSLPNRRTFDARLELEFARSQRDAIVFSLAILDIDHFKRVNDTYGHPAGDRVLSRMGEVFTAEARSDELVARVGGEEFAWILHGVEPEQALIAVERVRARVAATDFGEVGRVTLSVGVCAVTDGMDSAALYRGADLALLHAKRTGRDRVVLAESGTPTVSD